MGGGVGPDGYKLNVGSTKEHSVKFLVDYFISLEAIAKQNINLSHI